MQSRTPFALSLFGSLSLIFTLSLGGACDSSGDSKDSDSGVESGGGMMSSTGNGTAGSTGSGGGAAASNGGNSGSVPTGSGGSIFGAGEPSVTGGSPFGGGSTGTGGTGGTMPGTGGQGVGGKGGATAPPAVDAGVAKDSGMCLKKAALCTADAECCSNKCPLTGENPGKCR